VKVPRCREHNAPLADHPICDLARRLRVLFGEPPAGAERGLTVGVGQSRSGPIAITGAVTDDAKETAQ
jgi:hypothetical protein